MRCAIGAKQEIWVINQVWGQDGWILAKAFFCVFMDWDEVEVHKLAQKERRQYPAILTKQTWSIKDKQNVSDINLLKKNQLFPVSK